MRRDRRAGRRGPGRRVGCEPDRERVGTGHAEASSHRPSRRASPRRPSPGIDRSTTPTTRRSSGVPARSAPSGPAPTASPRRSARPAGHDRRAAGVDRREGRGSVAGRERQPAVGRQVGADDRRGVGPDAVEGDVERGDRADPVDARARPRDLGLDALVRGDRADRGQDQLARDDVGRSSAPAAARACWPTPPSATIIARPTSGRRGSGPSGSGRGRPALRARRSSNRSDEPRTAARPAGRRPAG